MSMLHSPHFSSWVRGHLLCSVADVTDSVALTFDDGPSSSATPLILDTLLRHQAHATFFTLARNVNRRRDLVRRMVDEGHEVALHGDLHWPLPLLTPGLIRREVERSAAAVARAVNVRIRHYRPPFGFMVPSQARFVAGLGYVSVLGDIYPEDTYRPGIERIVARVIPRLAPGSILIMHDGSPFGEADRGQTVDALALILRHMHERRLRGVSVTELLAMSPAKTGAANRSLKGGEP